MDEILRQQQNPQHARRQSLLLLPVSKLHQLKFVIAGYQRGYKWRKKEILELLNDIHEFDATKGIYCLQPIILKPIVSEVKTIELQDQRWDIYKENEIIDGQQRTTSLFIILKFLKYSSFLDSAIEYTIDYKIRRLSQQFLESGKDNSVKDNLIKDNLADLFAFLPAKTAENLDEKRYEDLSSVNGYWKEYKEIHRENDNVDIYHFFVVAFYIKLWFNRYQTDAEARKIFIDKLLNHTHLIWYSLDDSIADKNVITVFLNNNKGKILLTTSELIKALFILDIRNRENKAVADYKINRFALEWDSIEKRLQDDTFWYFIQPDPKRYTQGTRIDFLFDLLLKKSPKEVDDTFAYRYFEQIYNKQIRNVDANLFENEWGRVVQLFHKLVDWYSDGTLYHYIGFLTVSGIKSLAEVLQLSNVKKDVFLEALKTNITVEFGKTKVKDGSKFYPYHIDNLSYEESYDETQHVLLLYNVLYYVNSMSDNKFPFELYVKQKWSIEHIVPQNPKEIDEYRDFKKWIRDQINFQGEPNRRHQEGLFKHLNKYASFDDYRKDKELVDKVNKLIESFTTNTHQISNLVLLDRNTNSALGNMSFNEKRKRILNFDKSGGYKKEENEYRVFIPVETLSAFNKTFSEKVQFSFWSCQDGERYKESINERLNQFLPKESLHHA
ncbi:DUF262 domain-containing protein [Sphingobacterium thalpophilum]|uniref:DUF262 domain-containing protein n=1 Tax=Sphingobacterium thalpophilum TaxID=259 RepID=UPI003DA2E488